MNKQLEAASAPIFPATTAYGVYLKTATPEFVPIARASGLDFIRIDLQHGIPDPGRASQLIAAARQAGLGVGVRVPKDSDVTRSVLALGVDSVTFPGVESATEAADLVEWCAGRVDVVSMQIETRRGLEQVAAVARVDGVDVLHCGRSDLGRSLGITAVSVQSAELDTAEDTVLFAAAAAGKLGALHWPPGAGNLDRIRRWIADGIAWLTLGADTQILRSALTNRFDLVSGRPVDARFPHKKDLL